MSLTRWSGPWEVRVKGGINVTGFVLKGLLVYAKPIRKAFQTLRTLVNNNG